MCHNILCRPACITMTPWWAQWRLKSPASPLFTQPFIRAQIKENIKTPHHWLLCGEFTGDLWIPRTKDQLRGKCFHFMTSSSDFIRSMVFLIYQDKKCLPPPKIDKWYEMQIEKYASPKSSNVNVKSFHNALVYKVSVYSAVVTHKCAKYNHRKVMADTILWINWWQQFSKSFYTQVHE